MKQGKKATRAQRKLLEKNGFDPYVWRVTKDTPEALSIVNPQTNDTETITK